MANGAFTSAGSEFRVNSTWTGVQTDLSFAALADGGFVAIWTDLSGTGGDSSGSSVKAQRFDSAGVAVGAEFLINSATGNNQDRASVTALKTGGFVVTWSDASGLGGDADRGSVKAQIYDTAGARVGGEFLANTTTVAGQSDSTITALAGGAFIVSWVDASATAPDAKGSGVRAQLFSATGSKIGGEFLVNSTITGSQVAPALAGLASGGFVATWVDYSGLGGDSSGTAIKAQLFSSTGAKLGGELLVNSTTLGAQDQPVITALAGGGFAIVWRDSSGLDDTSASGLRGQIYDAAGARTGGEFRVNTTTFNAQDQPSIAATADGGFAVSWRDNSNIAADASGFGIKTQLFDSIGQKLGGEFQANEVVSGNQEMPAVTVLASGALLVGWTDYSTASGDVDGGIKARLFAPTTPAITDIEVSRNALSETEVENSIVAVFSGVGALNASYSYRLVDDSTGGAFAIEGNKLIVEDSLALDYETNPVVSITVRATDTFGDTFDKTFTFGLTDAVNEYRYSGAPEVLANTNIAASQLAPAVTTLADGRSVIVWTDGSGVGGDTSSFGIKAQLIAADGSKIGGEFRVNAQTLGAQDAPAVTALASGGFAVTWSDANAGSDGSASSVKAQLFDASGAAVGGELLVNTATLNAQKAPVIAALANGGFVVSWTDASLQGGDASATSVKAQVYDAAGNHVGGELLVNTATNGAQDSSAVSGLQGGGFVVTWRDGSLQGGDASKDAVKAQLFGSDGSKVGGEFLVNTETAGSQQAPVVAALSTGGFAIAWADNSSRGGDADYFGIRFQLYDAAGGRVGGETLANTTTLAGQLAPTITALAGGNFAISWADYSGVGAEIGTAGIKAQVFASDGAAVGGEFLVNHQTLGSQVDPAITGTGDGGFLVSWTDYGGQGGDDQATGIKYRLFDPLASQGTPPVLIARADTVAATEDQTTVIAAATLLANDTDSNGAPFALTGVAALSGGTAAIDADGNVVFTPLANFAGTALLSYTIADSAGETAIGRVNVQVANVNDAPVAAADQLSIDEGATSIAAAALLANDRDIDPGDTLRLAAVAGTTANGLALTLAGTTIQVATPASYQALRANETVVDHFDYTVADRAGATATASVTLTFVGANDAPSALTLDRTRVDENAAVGTVVGTLSGYDVDHDETLRYRLLDDAGGRFAVDATTGALTVANGALLDYETATSHLIQARVTDAAGATFDASFTISLNNLPEPKSYTGSNSANTFVAPTNDLWTMHGLGGNDVLTGNASSDVLYGDANNDILDGAGGADLLYGGIGSDTFYVDDVGDRVIEFYGEGTDLVYTSVDFTLEANVEQLTILGSANLSATGNDFANTMTGNAGDNLIRGGLGGDLLIGMEGNDTLYGEAGGDYLQGGAGADTLVGGAGGDELIGGAGADRFVFDYLGAASERDTVKDFVAGEDRLVLAGAVFTAFAGRTGAIAASELAIGGAATTADQHLVYNQTTGALYYDADGAGGAAMVQIALLSTRPVLGATDFHII